MPQKRLFVRTGEAEAALMLEILSELFEDDGLPVATSETDEKARLWEASVYAEEPDWEELVGGLGTRFRLLQTHGFKVWPSCGYTRPTNAAAIPDFAAEIA